MSQSPIQVLLVEDNPADAALMRELLKETSHGHFVFTDVKRLDNAFDRLANSRFDVLLLDLGLPDSQGLDTLRLVQARHRDLPVVVLTGLDDDSTSLVAVQEGAQDYLVKGELATNTVARTILYAIERKRAEKEFQALEQRLELAVDAAQLGIFTWNIKTRQIYWCRHHARLFGMEPAELTGTYDSFIARVHPDDRAEVNQRIQQSIERRVPYTCEYRVVWPDGSEHWIDATGRVFSDDDGSPDRMLCTGLDVTERRLEREREATRIREAEMAHLSRVSTMGQMASGLAHELNQPLAAILNYAYGCLTQAESGGQVTPTMMTALKAVMDESLRAGAIISRLRSMVRKQRPIMVSVDVNQLVTEAIRLMDSEVRRRSIRPQLNLAKTLPMVSANAVQIQQVLVNLILNALEALDECHSPDKQVTVQTRLCDDGHSVEVIVIDSGPGVTPEQIARLFDPFFTTKPEGIGMGLNISRSIIETHGGQLNASANPKRGMRFSFTLPVLASRANLPNEV